MKSMQGSTDDIIKKRLLARANQMKNVCIKTKIETTKLSPKLDSISEKSENILDDKNDKSINKTNIIEYKSENVSDNKPENKTEMEGYESFLDLRYEEGLSEMDMRIIYSFYCKEVSNGRKCITNAKKYIQDLHNRSDIAGYDNKSIIDFIQYGQKRNNEYIIINGVDLSELNELNNDLPVVDICDISPEYKSKLINVRLKCILLTSYKPYDKEELEKYRCKLKSNYCKCINKRCIRTIKDIQQPKLPFSMLIFRKLKINEIKIQQELSKSIDNLNMTYLNKYFDAITSFERRSFTRNIYRGIDQIDNEEIPNVDNIELKKEISNTIINRLNKLLLNEYIENIPIIMNEDYNDEYDVYF